MTITPSRPCKACGRDHGIEDSDFCSRCHDLKLIHESFNSALVRATELASSDPDAALLLLDSTLSKHHDRDVEGWLLRSVHAERAEILAEHGRLDEALAELRIVEQCTAPGTDDHAQNKHAMAIFLCRAGKPTQAIAEIESALHLRDRLHIEAVGGLLMTYADAAARAGLEVPDAYMDDAKRYLQACGVVVDEELLSHGLRDVILHAQKAMTGAQRRYSQLRRTVRGEPSDVAAEMVTQYIKMEPVGRYRDLAREFRDSLAEGSGQGH